MALRVAINGFGRIGRCVLRSSLQEKAMEFLAINDLTDGKILAHLLKYDSVHGVLNIPVTSEKGYLVVGGKSIEITSVKNPAELPWKRLGVDLVIEATGLFTDRESASRHLSAGARQVIITAPAKDPDLTVVMGVNEKDYDPRRHHILSNASCTTNCLATVVKVIDSAFGLRRCHATTIHSYTNDQSLLDLPHEDLRRARAAALSMIPTTTGAARAVTAVLPHLAGKIDGLAIRVPTPNVSLVDLVAEVGRETTAAEVNASVKKAAEGELRGILDYTEEPLVSVDLNGNPHSAIVDGAMTKVIEKRMIKVLAWYDNEWGYSCRVRDLIRYLADKA